MDTIILEFFSLFRNVSIVKTIGLPEIGAIFKYPFRSFIKGALVWLQRYTDWVWIRRPSVAQHQQSLQVLCVRVCVHDAQSGVIFKSTGSRAPISPIDAANKTTSV